MIQQQINKTQIEQAFDALAFEEERYQIFQQTEQTYQAAEVSSEEKDEPDTEKIEVSQNLFAAMHYYASKAQMTVVQLLEEIFQPKMDCANWLSYLQN